MYVVTAHMDGDTWSYGPFTDWNKAEQLAMALAKKYLNVEYAVGDLIRPQDEELLRELA